MIELLKYQTASGQIPFDDWLNTLRDRQGRARILVRLDRLKLGLPGDWKAVGNGVYELRIPTGPGYRVYYGWQGQTAVLLLCGGDKSSQSRDIDQAKDYWRDHNERNSV